MDNDGDGLIDLTDPGCSSSGDATESGESCQTPQVLAYSLQPSGSSPWYESEEAYGIGNWRSQGFSVTFSNRSKNPVLTTALLSAYDVVILLNGCGGAEGTPSSSELNAIRDFYLGGGSLVLEADDDVGDNRAAGSCQERVNAVAQKLGVQFASTADHRATDGTLVSCQPVNREHALLSVVAFIARSTDAIMTLGGTVSWGTGTPFAAGRLVGDSQIALAAIARGATRGGVVFDSSFFSFADVCPAAAQLRQNVMGFLGYKLGCAESSSSVSSSSSSKSSSVQSSSSAAKSSSSHSVWVAAKSSSARSSQASSVQVWGASSSLRPALASGAAGQGSLGGSCGNGKVDTGEQCDDGWRNGAARNSCTSACMIASDCGNGIVERGEQCDNGAANGLTASTCTESCGTVPVCGNRVLDAKESCDDGNTTDGDGCSAQCRLEAGYAARCGDGIVEEGEQCDDGQRNGVDGAPCAGDCRFVPVCGNGRLDVDEQCDDANRKSRDGCSDACSIEVQYYPQCGNLRLDAGEACDDGNLRGKDGCSSLCQMEAGHVARCGNTVVERMEECDDGSKNGKGDSICSGECRFRSSLCGNGLLDPGESCEDGGISDGDGCSAGCMLEAGVQPACGDRIIEVGEECDRGLDNGRAGGACTIKCKATVRGALGSGGSGSSLTTSGSLRTGSGSASTPTVITLPFQSALTASVMKHAPQGRTGPATVAIISIGAAVGYAWVRRKRK